MRIYHLNYHRSLEIKHWLNIVESGAGAFNFKGRWGSFKGSSRLRVDLRGCARPAFGARPRGSYGW